MKTNLLTIKEIADRLNLSVHTIRCWCRGYYNAGRGPQLTRPFIKPIHIGRQVRFKESEFNRWVEEQAA